MARHIPFDKPVNEAEGWALTLLRDGLPDDYILLTNLEILTDSGQLMEIDALVIGDHAVYLIDVKGYVGRMEVGKDVWELDGRSVENSLRKVNGIARVLAGRMQRKATGSVRAPWCQGMVLVTGRQGSEISLVFDGDPLSVYTPEGIIDALTRASGSTAPMKFPVTDAQRELALRTIGQVQEQEQRQRLVAGYRRDKVLFENNGVRISVASLDGGQNDQIWLLREVIRSQCPDSDTRQREETALRRQFHTLQQLVGVPGMGYAAPLIDTGESLILPIRYPAGKQLADTGFETDRECALVIRQLLDTVRAVHQRGCTFGQLDGNTVFVTPWGGIEIVDVLNQGSVEADLAVLRVLVEALPRRLESLEGIEAESAAEWFEHAVSSLHDAANDGRVEPVTPDLTPFIPAPGVVIAGRYELRREVENDGVSSLWEARHLAGRFDCGLRIYDAAEEIWDAVSERYGALARVYHPLMERVFDIERIEGSDSFFVSRSWAEGISLQSIDQQILAQHGRGWLIGLLELLDYLHGVNIYHRAISPECIIVEGSRAVLVAFNSLPDVASSRGNLRYGTAWSLEGMTDRWTELLALLQSFVAAFTGTEPLSGEGVEYLVRHGEMPDWLVDVVEIFTHMDVSALESAGYLFTLGLDETSGLITELPAEFCSRWGISKGYMTFLIIDMLNDQRPRSRNQWVLNVFRSRKFPASQKNRASMSATISNAKRRGIIEEHGAKIRLTKSFIDNWDSG